MADNVCDQGAEHRLFRDILLYSLMTTYEAQLSSTCLPTLSLMCCAVGQVWDTEGTSLLSSRDAGFAWRVKHYSCASSNTGQTDQQRAHVL